jgi:Nuclease-related domain
LPLLVVTGGATIAAGLVRLFSPWHPAFFSGVLIGAAFAMALWAWDDPPEVIAKWGRGAEGERRTGTAIRSLKRRGWASRHDLQGKYGNLDHVVVGPGGVFLLDSKSLSGTARVEEGVFTVHFEASPINDSALPRLPRWMHGAASGLRDRLLDKLGWIVDVHPVVVLCGNFPQRIAQCDGVPFVAVDALAEWLETQPRRLSDGDRAAVVAAVNDLPSAHAIAEGIPAAPKDSSSRA